MTITTEMLRVSAEKVGKRVDEPDPGSTLVVVYVGGGIWTEWHPPTNAEQDRMLRDWLLSNGYVVSYEPPNSKTSHEVYHVDKQAFCFDCPPNELCTRAVWEVSK